MKLKLLGFAGYCILWGILTFISGAPQNDQLTIPKVYGILGIVSLYWGIVWRRNK